MSVHTLPRSRASETGSADSVRLARVRLGHERLFFEAMMRVLDRENPGYAE